MSETITRLSFFVYDGFVFRYNNDINRVVFYTYEETWKAIIDNTLLEYPIVFSLEKISEELTQDSKNELLLLNMEKI